jgi:hypothetical protein
MSGLTGLVVYAVIYGALCFTFGYLARGVGCECKAFRLDEEAKIAKLTGRALDPRRERMRLKRLRPWRADRLLEFLDASKLLLTKERWEEIEQRTDAYRRLRDATPEPPFEETHSYAQHRWDKERSHEY